MAFMTIRNKSNSFTWISLAALVQFGQTCSIYSRIVKKAIQYAITDQSVDAYFDIRRKQTETIYTAIGD